MHIRLQIRVHPRVYVTSGTVSFDAHDDLDTFVNIHFRTNADNQQDVHADAYIERDCPSELASEVRDILDGKTRFLISGYGGPEPSAALTRFAEEHQAKMLAAAVRVFEVARWRFAVSTPVTALYADSLWVGDSWEDWKNIPTERKPHASTHRNLMLRERTRGPVEALLAARHAEPIGHELRREALAVAMGNPRSALVIGLAALEAGFKAMVVALTPDAEWFAMHAPSPPLVQMLTNYFAVLPVKAVLPQGGAPSIPRYVKQIVERAVKLRNKVIHIGAPPMTDEETTDFLDCVGDLLYLFDYSVGHTWAERWISQRFKDGLPKAPLQGA